MNEARWFQINLADKIIDTSFSVNQLCKFLKETILDIHIYKKYFCSV